MKPNILKCDIAGSLKGVKMALNIVELNIVLTTETIKILGVLIIKNYKYKNILWKPSLIS